MATDANLGIPAHCEAAFSLDGKTIRGGSTERRDPLTGRLSGAIPIGKDPTFPWELIGGEINAASLARIAELMDELAAAKSKSDAALADLKAKLDAATADASDKGAKLTAALADVERLTPKPTTEPDVLSKLHAKFDELLPPAAQSAFAVPYAIVRVLVQAGQPALARAVIEQTPVPPELSDAKAQILALL